MDINSLTFDKFNISKYHTDANKNVNFISKENRDPIPRSKKKLSDGLQSFDTPVFHHSLSWNDTTSKFYGALYNDLPTASKYYIDFAKIYTHSRFSPRHGHWTQPYPTPQMPELAMPSYAPNFNKTWTEITDNRAQWVKELIIREPNRKIAIYYSGGIDSLVVLIALLKVLNTQELRSKLTICCSMESVIEYPNFFRDEIYGKFNIIDLKMGVVRFNDLIARGFTIITADLGDAMFGTEVSTQFYYTFRNHAEALGFQGRKLVGDLLEDIGKADSHYSVYKDVLIAYLGAGGVYSKDANITEGFGEWYYNKLDTLAKSSDYTVFSLHDFFWQIIFNVKWMHCSCRCFMYFGDSTNNRHLFQGEKLYINWNQDDDYQRWSMVNNNTGQKIKGVTAATYKWAAREYIYDYTKDDWALYFKLKIASFQKIAHVMTYAHSLDVMERFAVNTDYQIVRLTDPGVEDYIKHHLFNNNALV